MAILSTAQDTDFVEYDGQRYARWYDDGASDSRVDASEAQEAERAYRDAFVATAREVVREWRVHNHGAFEAAFQARRQAQEHAQVLIPSADYFGLTDPELREMMEGEQVAYRASYRSEAARLRGICHAYAYVDEAWDAALGRIQVWSDFTFAVLAPWLNALDAWSARPVRPDVNPAPPRPVDGLTDQQRAELDSPFLPVNVPEVQPHPLRPRFRSISEMAKDHPRLREPVIEGLLREGESMNVIANPKVGKSWLVTDLALSVASGVPWLGCPTYGGDVLILDNELHGETTANRVPRVADVRGLPLKRFGDRLFVENLRGRLPSIFDLETYFCWIRARRFKVIILDALYRFLPKGMAENDNGGMAEVYNQIDRYAQRLSASFILIHHTTKGNQSEKSVTDVGAGAGAQSRAADAHLVLRPHREPGAVVLDAAVRSWPPVEARCLRWRFPVFDLAADLDPTQLKGLRDRRGKGGGDEWSPGRFVDAFVGDEPATRAAIIAKAIKAGLSDWAAGKLLRQADAEGLMERQGEGKRNEPYLFKRVAMEEPS